MNNLRWNRIRLSLLSSLATSLLATGLYAQSPASVGIVRITDQAHRMPKQSRRARQSFAPRVRQVSAERGYLTDPAPQVVSNYAHAKTGHPVVDLIRTVSARKTTSIQPIAESGCSSCESGNCESGSCELGGCGSGGCSSGLLGSLFGGGCSGGCDDCDDDSNFGRLLRDGSDAERSFLRRLFGYFIPDGCCGEGCPPFGTYHLNYSANPRYFDKRDGGVYAAQGYNVPMAVPLAPNVRQTYNYGWGIPSSRLTPISTRAPF